MRIVESLGVINDTKKKYIDAVKGFCILMVVIVHAGGIPIIDGYITACYMQTFFIIGGITYKDRRGETFGEFAVKKARRLLKPYFIYATVLLLIDAILNHRNMSDIMIGGGGILYARHCLWIYHGHENNIFMLDNMNGQLWFLPAMFLTYLLFWQLVKADKRKRTVLLILYLCMNIATDFLPFLLPWSLDTVFVTSVLMYMGYHSKEYIQAIECLDMRSVFRPKILVSLSCMMLVYYIAVKINGGINTSVRIFGDHKILDVFLYMAIGCIGTLAYIIAFVICEKTCLLRIIAEWFEYLGQRTIEILATHIMIFCIIEKACSYAGVTNTYMIHMGKIVVAIVVGIAFSIMLEKLSAFYRKSKEQVDS